MNWKGLFLNPEKKKSSLTGNARFEEMDIFGLGGACRTNGGEKECI
jgi:hypothetical protein